MGSWDLFLLNHYTTAYYYPANVTYPNMGWADDQGTGSTYVSLQGVPIGPVAASSWLYVVPWGIYEALSWIHHRYKNAIYNGKSEDLILLEQGAFPFLITENGVGEWGTSKAVLIQY